jgi:hypothetical protein
MTLVLGIGNKARQGKDSFATAIEDYFIKQNVAAEKHWLSTYKPVIVQRHAFADALYQEVNQYLASPWGKSWLRRDVSLKVIASEKENAVIIPDGVHPDPNAEVNFRAPYGKHATLLQFWGTEYRRSQDPEYWVKKWKAGIDPKANIVLTTDMRFWNEAWAIKNAGGFTVRVNRLNADGTPFVDPSRDANHPSETQLDGYNFDYQLTVKTGDVAILGEWAITLVHYLRAMKGHK